MSEASRSTPAEWADAVYGDAYYHSHCGDVPYTADSAYWLEFYSRIADEIVRSLAPTRVFDAGCAIGFLVAALWDRNVETHGRDVSSFAISQVRPDVRANCEVGSIADPIIGEYDLILCIEVLEHMPEDEALQAIRTMAASAPRILFSSTPTDFDEPTHVNVRPIKYWLDQFAVAGLTPVPGYDASFVAPHAMLLQRLDDGPTARDLVAFAEIVRQRLEKVEEQKRAVSAAEKLSEAHQLLAAEQDKFRANYAALVIRLEDAERRAAALTLAAQARRMARRAGNVARWTLTLQLPARLEERRVRRAAELAAGAAPGAAPRAVRPPDAHEAIAIEFGACDPLRTYRVENAGRRISIMTDSIGAGFLYGGVGTAMILATMLAQRWGARLRLITRVEPADIQRFRELLDTYGLSWDGDIEVEYSPPLGDHNVTLGDQDVVITTSWWTTRSALGGVPKARVLYLLQEDERMFYPRGDERLRCEEVLNEPGLRCLVNSELLFRHLVDGPEPVDGFAERATWFEPAFPETLFYDDGHRDAHGARRTLLFYARPNNLRNLYWRGLEVLVAAIEDGVLDPLKWSITFVGRDLERVELPGGVVPQLLQNLPWDKYAEFVRGVDVGLSLMDTPHASYPPLDLAASGAVVVTNQCGLKTSLSQYSDNIIVAPRSVAGLTDGLRTAVALVADQPRRRGNYAGAGMSRDWQTSLEPAIQRCLDWVTG